MNYDKRKDKIHSTCTRLSLSSRSTSKRICQSSFSRHPEVLGTRDSRTDDDVVPNKTAISIFCCDDVLFERSRIASRLREEKASEGQDKKKISAQIS